MTADQIASFTTAGGTLVLAVATFAATRSANRSSRIAERALLTGLQPVLLHAHLHDPPQKIGFGDQHAVHLEGPGAAVEAHDGIVYMAIALRNVGQGIAVLQAWHPWPERVTQTDHAPLDGFRRQSRDIFVPAGGLGFWQGAFRDPAEPLHGRFRRAAEERTPVTIELLYSDMQGGQNAVTRFYVSPRDEGGWLASVSRHWMVDGPGPRG